MLTVVLPKEFSFRGFESRSRLGALPGIIHFSTSFRNAIRCGYMPPLHIFNAYVATCRDDIDEEAQSALDIVKAGDNRDEVYVSQGILSWPEFQLNHSEYEFLIEFIIDWYRTVNIEDFGATDYGQWFVRCFATSIRIQPLFDD